MCGLNWTLEIRPKRCPFPSVNDIKADMQRCGNIGQTGLTISYSFGTKTPEGGFCDALNPRGNIFNDVLTEEWFVCSGSVGEAVKLSAPGRQALLVARIDQAMAELSHAEIFLVVMLALYHSGGRRA